MARRQMLKKLESIQRRMEGTTDAEVDAALAAARKEIKLDRERKPSGDTERKRRRPPRRAGSA